MNSPRNTFNSSSHPIRIGISACLLGEKVRYDGNHKWDSFITQNLGNYFTWVPVCPEVEMGLPVPRAPMNLVRKGNTTRLLTQDDRVDLTGKMHAYAEARLKKLSRENIAGFILKKKSPSCGLKGVPISNSQRKLHSGSGLFASALSLVFPHLPLIEEDRLNDPRWREVFIRRVFTHHRWRLAMKSRVSFSKLLRFHARHQFLFMAHNKAGTRRLDALLNRSLHPSGINTLVDAYRTEMDKILSQPCRRSNQVDVFLNQFAGIFREKLSSAEKSQLTRTLNRYREGRLPWSNPAKLIRRFLSRYKLTSLQDQIYIFPNPHEWALLGQL